MFFPLFLLPYILFKFLCCGKRNVVDNQVDRSRATENINRKFILQLVAEPYNIDQLGGFCWEGIVILRRLILVIIATQATSIISKHVLLFVMCLLSLSVHMYLQPFKFKSSNTLESVSLSALVIIAGMNLVKAVYSDSSLIPPESSDAIFETYDIAEMAVVTLLPFAILCIILICGMIFLLTCCCCRRSVSDKNEMTNSESPDHATFSLAKQTETLKTGLSGHHQSPALSGPLH